jgi:hypothetical protein
VDECKPLIIGVESIGGLRVLAINILGRFLANKVGRCRLTVSKFVLKAPMVPALEAIISYSAFTSRFQNQYAPLQQGQQHPLRGAEHAGQGGGRGHAGEGLHSFTSDLNLSAFCGIGGAFRGCFGGVKGCLGCVMCQKRLRLS